jgi:hypothetical protein
VGSGVPAYEPPGRQARQEFTTPKARAGFDGATSRLVQSGTGGDFELYENADEEAALTRTLQLIDSGGSPTGKLKQGWGLVQQQQWRSSRHHGNQ